MESSSRLLRWMECRFSFFLILLSESKAAVRDGQHILGWPARGTMKSMAPDQGLEPERPLLNTLLRYSPDGDPNPAMCLATLFALTHPVTNLTLRPGPARLRLYTPCRPPGRLTRIEKAL